MMSVASTTSSVQSVDDDADQNVSDTAQTLSLGAQSAPPDFQSPKPPGHLRPLVTGDLSSAAALRAQYGIDVPKPIKRRHKKMTTQILDDNDELVVDQTMTLPLHSKKTERLQRKQQKRSEKLAHQQATTIHLLSLPNELLSEIFADLQPADIASLLLTNRYLHSFISDEESAIAREIIHRRYWTIYRCFPLPVPFASVPEDAHASLLSPRRQEMLNIHRKPYQHIQMIDPHEFCTCLTCVFAWNNLCLILDLHHWQTHLENREPLPIIPRGANPTWNQDLLRRHADLVRAAVDRPIIYARILQLHLDTTARTIQRNSRWRRKLPGTTTAPTTSSSPRPTPIGTGSLAGATAVNTAPSKPKLYRLTDEDVESGKDEFLDRSGPPSYDFPFMRDNYYTVEAYLPNRRWSGENGKWLYWGLPPMQHERDLEWVRSWAMGVGYKG